MTLATLILLGIITTEALQAANPFPAESLRIVAVIAGADELHLSQPGSRWVHQI